MFLLALLLPLSSSTIARFASWLEEFTLTHLLFIKGGSDEQHRDEAGFDGDDDGEAGYDEDDDSEEDDEESLSELQVRSQRMVVIPEAVISRYLHTNPLLKEPVFLVFLKVVFCICPTHSRFPLKHYHVEIPTSAMSKWP